MAPHKTVTINGRLYDAVTGLPVEGPVAPKQTTAPAKKPATKPATKPVAASRGAATSEGMHSTMQRSKTLHRRATKKPAAPNKPITKRSTPGRHMDIARSASVARFAKDPVTSVAAPAPKSTQPVASAKAKADKPARIHPVAERAVSRHTAKKKPAAANKPTTAKQVKDAEISKALATPKTKQKTSKKDQKKGLRRLVIIGVVILALLVGAFVAWRLIPSISVSIAATQAGIAATYPEYTPDGYSLSQPVTYSDGEVALKFTSNSNDNYYTVNQTRSSWDSSAVLDNVVTPAAGADYTTTKERGLTIYSYGTSAAWVNGGILYQIDSKAPLTGDQIRKIATSL